MAFIAALLRAIRARGLSRPTLTAASGVATTALVSSVACASSWLVLTPSACDSPTASPVAPPPATAGEALRALASLEGEVAIVTGAATGIGRAVAELFVAAGARVYALDIQPVHLEGVTAVHVDVTDVRALTQAIHGAIAKESGRLDHLVCSAGVWTYGDLDKTSEAEFDRVVGVNVKGTFFALAAALPAMAERGKGSVVVIGSDQSFVGKPGQNLYGLTKAAIAQLVKSTAAQFAPKGVRVNAVCPGTVDTPLMRGAVAKISNLQHELVTWLQTAQPLPRLGTPMEIALAVALVSKVPFMTGALVPVDGGYTCQ